MRKIKCVLVGDDDVDKRELFLKYLNSLDADVESATETAEEGKSEFPGHLDQDAKVTLNDSTGQVDHVNTDGFGDVNTHAHPHFQVIHTDNESVDSEDSLSHSVDHWSGTVTVDGKLFFLELHDAHCEKAYDNIRPEMYTGADVFLVCFSVVRSTSLENAIHHWIPEIQHHCPVAPFLLVGTQTEWRELWDEKDPSRKPVYPAMGTTVAQQNGAVKYLECATSDNEVRNIFDSAILVSVMDRMELSKYHPDFEKSGSTLLHHAASQDHVVSLESLVDFIDVSFKDKNLQTALDVAISENNLKATRFLLENGCELQAQCRVWSKHCEFWVTDEGDDSPRVVSEDLNEFTRQITFFYASSSSRPLARILLVGQNGTDVAKFVNETVPLLPVRSLTVVNSEGISLFDLSQVQSSLESLSLTNCDLGSSELPGTIYLLSSLKSLCIVKCGISRLTEQLGALNNLERLRLSGNKIRKLPDTVSRLQKLRYLHCDRNLLECLPNTLGCLGALESLDLTSNKLEKLSASLGLLGKLRNLHFSRNKLKFPPTHVLNKGTEAILEFLSDFLDDPVANHQIKVALVGGHGVGKSTLLNAVKHTKDWRMSGISIPARTEGVDITTVNLMHFKLKAFDLGGDEELFSSHNFFLTENTLYQAVFDMSEYTVSKASLSIYQLGRLELWLQVIFSRAPNSHVLIVGTHADDPNLTEDIRMRIRTDIENLLGKYRREHRRRFEGEAVAQCVLCEGTLVCGSSVGAAMFYVQGQFCDSPHSVKHTPEPCIPHIIGFYEVSSVGQFPKSFLSSKNPSLQNFKVGLAASASVLLNSKVSSRIPQKCLYVRDRIQEMRHAESELKKWPLLTYDRLREIAYGCGVKQDFKLKALMTYFHSQGEILWYEDMKDIGDVIFIDPAWLSQQICLLVGARSGASSGLDGILRIDNLAKTWPSVSEGKRFYLLSLFRKLGMCFSLSETEYIVPFQLPIGRVDEETWPRHLSESDRQIACVFLFSFLPPAFFSDLTVAINRRKLPTSFDVEPTFYRFQMVFSTRSKASMGCTLHCHDMCAHPLAENTSSEVHRVCIEAIPFENKIKTVIRGPAPCCVLPDITTAIKTVVDTRYPGIGYVRKIVCPVCELALFKSPAVLEELAEEVNNVCSWGHSIGTKFAVLAGEKPLLRVKRKAYNTPVRGEVRAGVFFDAPGQILDDSCCPRLFAVLPIGFQSLPLRNCLRVNSPINDGYAVHFLCECPGYWHLTDAPGFRIPRIKEFLDEFGPRTCKLLKLAFMLKGEDSQDGRNESHVPVKILFGDPKLCHVLATDLQDLLEHYFVKFPELTETWTSFMEEDLDYIRGNEALSRSKLCKLLDISPDWWRLGPLVCTYSRRTDEHLWLCERHAL